MKSAPRLAAAALACAALSLTASVAQAQQVGGAPSWEQFHPGASQYTSTLHLDRPEVLDHMQFSGGIFAHFVDDPLQVLSDGGDGVESRIVDDQLKTEFGASIGLFDILQLNVSVPVIPYQSGEGLAAVGGTGGADGAYVSEIRTSIDATLIRPTDRGGFGLGISGRLAIPSGADASFNSDGVVRGGPTLNALWRTRSDFELLANLGFDFRSRDQIRNFSTGHAFRWGVGTVLPFAADGRLAALGNVFGTAPVSDPQNETVSDRYGGTTDPAEALAGLRYDFSEQFRMQAGGGTGITAGPGAPDFRLFLSAHFRTRPATRQREEPVPPEPVEPEPEPAATPPSDRDGDGIADADDACPDEAETLNGVDDEDGCPDEEKATVKIVGVQIQISEKIHFDTDKDEIRVEQGPVLDDLSTLLEKYPELTKVRIVGHADSRGTEEYNQKLSERRADAVLGYLVDRGIEADRLETEGRGEREPIGDNRTAEGQWKNRRVGFLIQTVKGEPVEGDTVQFDRLVD